VGVVGVVGVVADVGVVGVVGVVDDPASAQQNVFPAQMFVATAKHLLYSLAE
jgi:hypothetical protein